MTARWIDHDHIEVPARAETGTLVGDGVLVLGADDDGFTAWADWLAGQGSARPSK